MSERVGIKLNHMEGISQAGIAVNRPGHDIVNRIVKEELYQFKRIESCSTLQLDLNLTNTTN